MLLFIEIHIKYINAFSFFILYLFLLGILTFLGREMSGTEPRATGEGLLMAKQVIILIYYHVHKQISIVMMFKV